MSVAKAQNNIGGHCTEKMYTEIGRHHTYFLDGGTIGMEKKCILVGGGGTAHTLLMMETIGAGTPHNIDPSVKIQTPFRQPQDIFQTHW